MHFKSLDDLNEDVTRWLPAVPRDIDLIVGVPRSGMLPATILALHLHVPLTSIEGYLHERVIRSGQRLAHDAAFSLDDPAARVLVVDDSVCTGRQLTTVRQRIQGHVRNQVVYGAPYVAPGGEAFVDLYHEVVPMPRVFEWNVLNHDRFLRSACVDIDGVLCRDPTEDENDDGPAYRAFLEHADPLYIPQHPIQALVTSRLEKYREPTEAWLARQGIVYDQLIMMDYPTAAARRAANRYADHKAAAYIATGAELFIESSYRQAVGIARLAGKPVYCVDRRQMIQPSTWSTGYLKEQVRSRRDRLHQLLRRMWQSPRDVPGKVAEALFKRAGWSPVQDTSPTSD